jgi:hypothetical protein
MRALGVNPGAITLAAAHAHPDCRGIPILSRATFLGRKPSARNRAKFFQKQAAKAKRMARFHLRPGNLPKFFEYGISQSGGPIESGEEKGRQKTSLIGAFSCSFPVALAFLRGANLIHD